MSKPINKWEKPFHVERGDVYMGAVNLDSDPQKGIQRGYRPLLVTQSDWQNRKSESVIVVPGTSELKKTGMCTHVVIPLTRGLSRQTMFCCEQRAVVNVNQFEKYCCTLPPDIMKKITRACRLAERGAKIKCRKQKTQFRRSSNIIRTAVVESLLLSYVSERRLGELDRADRTQKVGICFIRCIGLHIIILSLKGYIVAVTSQQDQIAIGQRD